MVFSGTPNQSAGGNGLYAEYYDDKKFKSLKFTRLDETINFNWGRRAPIANMGRDTFSVRWTGQIQPLHSENYTFNLKADDGARLWVDGELVIDRRRNNRARSQRGTIQLEAGKKYDIKLEYFENRGKAVAQLEWSSRSQTRQIVPTSQLFNSYQSVTPAPVSPTPGSIPVPTGTSAIPTAPTNNLDISAATLFGNGGQDYAYATDLSVDSKFAFVGGSFPSYNPGGQAYNLLGGGTGALIRYNTATNQVVSTTRLPGAVEDLEVNPVTGQIAIAGDFGVALLSADASQIIWSNTSFTDATRVATSGNGQVAVMRDRAGAPDQILLYNALGQVVQQWDTGLTTRHFNDVAVTDQNGGIVIATGYDQKTADLQVAFGQAWDLNGKQIWKNYDFSSLAVENANLMADTRGERVAIGRDGQLYLAGSINGGTGASIFSRDPLNIAQSAAAQTVTTDSYNTPTNVGSIVMTWFGRYDALTGGLVKGQSLLARQSSGQGNTVRVNSITADEMGQVYLGGEAAGSIANRNLQQIKGQTVAPYAPYDGYLAIISADFSQRYAWTPVSKAKVNAVSVRNGVAVSVATTTAQQITYNAVQSSYGGAEDGYLFVVGGQDIVVSI
ncbi:MAG TPA: hypothetical protein IGS53_05055 [Leptolyngbyaceae cyanobacterium M33_DOE_097]|uniref:PA14 domain-containing protein n=1 Tax=Oscillatoriales cyanobacterium SpSt-418 TaxID=2282169 RepID=A0A7C3KDM5_9CYAN|nr:hypothetical protein [Leptolyngbyaceae cyanobacterium M33_DOE_097]